jgi:hypothetical protein
VIFTFATRPAGYCSECGQECDGILIEDGIGPYECFGATGVHRSRRWVSPCCEAEIVAERPGGESAEDEATSC